MAYRRTNVRSEDLIPVPGGLNVGSQIVIRGRVQEHETRFAVNLKCGDGEDDDIALHFNPRNDGDETVVRNTYRDGSWEDEERDIPRFPFDNGRKFTLRIFTYEDYYRILVNNYDFTTFSHRMPYSDVRFVQLGSGAEYYEATIQNNCRAPFFGEFPGGLRVGQAVRVRGLVKDDADRFAVNFQMDRDGDEVGFHFNPRQDQEDVVLNALLGGDWGEEQRGYENDFAFKRGEFFDAFFIATEDRFNVYVNEKYFTTFSYRCHYGDINYLTVSGDVELMDVEMMDPLPDDFVKEIPQGMEKNDLVAVKGFFFPEGQRFAVNLMKGYCCEDDIALHFNPRRDDGEVVLNSKEGGDWEEEERHGLPYAMQDIMPFEVEILAKKHKFKLYANGRKICKFRARDDIECIRGINVTGDAYIYQVKLLKKSDDVFTDTVPGKLQAGNWVVVQGAPDDDCERFAVNLQCGPDEDSDVAFHFNPRFSEMEVVRNTRLGGDWGDEERHQPDFPFIQENHFEIAFCLLHHGIRVYVNRQRFIDYNHRVSPECITHIRLSGECDFFEPEFF